jgi:hypothetical protein
MTLYKSIKPLTTSPQEIFAVVSILIIFIKENEWNPGLKPGESLPLVSFIFCTTQYIQYIKIA